MSEIREPNNTEKQFVKRRIYTHASNLKSKTDKKATYVLSLNT